MCSVLLLLQLHMLSVCTCGGLIACQLQASALQEGSVTSQEGSPTPACVQLESATAVQCQLHKWQAEHKDMLHTDVMQAMDESSDSESMVVEGNQVMMHAHSSSLGSFHSPQLYDNPASTEQVKGQETVSKEQRPVHKPKGLFSFLTRALKKL